MRSTSPHPLPGQTLEESMHLSDRARPTHPGGSRAAPLPSCGVVTMLRRDTLAQLGRALQGCFQHTLDTLSRDDTVRLCLSHAGCWPVNVDCSTC